jgi:hypothetical protein
VDATNGLTPYSQLKTLQQAIQEKLDALDPNIPPLPEPEADPDDEGWLFDSQRNYLEQLDYYKKH